MEKKKWGVHISHCCSMHGCKYGDEDCPVTTAEAEQAYTCEWCNEDGFETVAQIKEYAEAVDTVKEAKEKGETSVTLSIDALVRLFKTHRM